MWALVVLLVRVICVVACFVCLAGNRIQNIFEATLGQCTLNLESQSQVAAQATMLSQGSAPAAAAALMQMPATTHEIGDRITVDPGDDNTSCTSRACKDAVGWLQPFINESVNPCEDFAAFTCSFGKKNEWRTQCEACAEFDFLCQLMSCMGSDMASLALKSKLILMGGVNRSVDPQQSPDKFMGAGLSSLTQAVKIAHAACASTPKVEDWWDKSERERRQTIIEKLGQPAMDYFQKQMLPPDASVEDLISESGFAMEPGRDWDELGLTGVYVNPLFLLVSSIDPWHPSQSTQVTLFPAMCNEGFSVDNRNLTFTMGVAEQMESKLPGGMLFDQGMARDAMSAFAELIQPNLVSCIPILSSLMNPDLYQVTPAVALTGLQAYLEKELSPTGNNSGRLELNIRDLLMKLGVPNGVDIHIADLGYKSAWAKRTASLFSARGAPRAKLALRFARFHRYLESIWLSRQDVVASSPENPPPASCLYEVKRMFPWFYARKFVTDVLPEKTRDSGEEIAWQLVEAFASNLDALPWLDKKTRLAAKKKLRRIRIKIGYPHWIMQDTLMKRQYGFALTFTSSMTWAEIQDIASRSQVQDIMSGIAKPRNWESFWMVTPDVFNMMYNPLANDIVGLAAFMQKPIIDVSMPMFFNFGFFGAVLGHELTHGFDSNGAKRGPFGDLKDWWTNASRAKFEASKSCFKRQYSSYPVHGDTGTNGVEETILGWRIKGQLGINGTELHDNGTKCLGENIADSGGLGLAAMAYQRWQKKHGAEQGVIVGGKFYTAEQLFYLRYGAGFCDLASSQKLQEQITFEDPHSVWRLRIAGAIQNSHGFAKAFQCPVGDSRSMNPKNKCELWGIDVTLPIQDWTTRLTPDKGSAAAWSSVTWIVAIVTVFFV